VAIWFWVRQSGCFSVELPPHVDDQYWLGVQEVEGTVPEIAKCPSVEAHGLLANDHVEVSFQTRRVFGDDPMPVTLRSENCHSSLSDGSIRVLICDDESRLVNLTAGLLREFGYEVLTVRCGADAVKCVAQQPVDVVILDVNLPGEDSLVIARRLTEERPVAIVLSSGFAEEDVESELLALPGVRAFLAKPYGIEVLSATIRRVVEKAK
jgi:CheY-like chemotaxis protein